MYKDISLTIIKCLFPVKGQDAPEWSFDLSVILVSGLTGSLINRGANVRVERKVLSSAKMTFNRLLSRAVFVSRGKITKSC